MVVLFKYRGRNMAEDIKEIRDMEVGALSVTIHKWTKE